MKVLNRCLGAVFFLEKEWGAARAEIGACFALDSCGDERNVVGRRAASATQRSPGGSEQRFPRIGAGVAQPDTASTETYLGSNFQQTQADGAHLCLGQGGSRQGQSSQGLHQHISEGREVQA